MKISFPMLTKRNPDEKKCLLFLRNDRSILISKVSFSATRTNLHQLSFYYSERMNLKTHTQRERMIKIFVPSGIIIIEESSSPPLWNDQLKLFAYAEQQSTMMRKHKRKVHFSSLFYVTIIVIDIRLLYRIILNCQC